MNARRRLNASYVQGSALVAALIGLVIASWSAFIVAWAVLLASNLITGDIRTIQPKS